MLQGKKLFTKASILSLCLVAVVGVGVLTGCSKTTSSKQAEQPKDLVGMFNETTKDYQLKVDDNTIKIKFTQVKEQVKEASKDSKDTTKKADDKKVDEMKVFEGLISIVEVNKDKKEREVKTYPVMGNYTIKDNKVILEKSGEDSLMMGFVYSYYVDKATDLGKKKVDLNKQKISLSILENTQKQSKIAMTTDFYDKLTYTITKADGHIYNVKIDKEAIKK